MITFALFEKNIIYSSFNVSQKGDPNRYQQPPFCPTSMASSRLGFEWILQSQFQSNILPFLDS